MAQDAPKRRFLSLIFLVTCILPFRSHNNNNNNNNNRLPSKISGWLANPGGKRLKPIEEIFQEELNAYLYVSTHLRGPQLQKFIYEIRTSGSHTVGFLRSAPLSKTFAQMCTALTLLDNGGQLESLPYFDRYTHFIICTVIILSCNHLL